MVDLQFYNDDMNHLDEINIGESRMNYGTITSVSIKNEGHDKAKDCIISATPLRTLSELKEKMSDEDAEKEYEKECIAASWKTFSLTESGKYVPELNLGTIQPQSWLKGDDVLEEKFNKEKSKFKDVWSYCLESWKDNSLKIYKNEAKSQTAQRMSIDLGKKKNIDIKFKLKYEYDSSEYAKSSCLVIFPVRVDNRGYGYILSFQFRASDGKCFFGVYKNGKGMTSNLNRTYGTRIFDTNGYKEFDQSKYIGAKIYTNKNDETCFEFILNGEKQVLYKTKETSIRGTTVVDTENNHPNAGDIFFDVGLYFGDLSITLSDFTIITENERQPIYIKSKIDNSATDKTEYESAITISYIER